MKLSVKFTTIFSILSNHSVENYNIKKLCKTLEVIHNVRTQKDDLKNPVPLVYIKKCIEKKSEMCGVYTADRTLLSDSPFTLFVYVLDE